MDLVRISVTFTDAVTLDLVDPTMVTLTLTPPPAPSTPVVITDIVHDGLGAYHYDLIVDVKGQWIYRWQGTGAVIASSGNGFLMAV